MTANALSNSQILARLQHCKQHKLDFVTLKPIDESKKTVSVFHKELNTLVKTQAPVVDLTK